MVIVIVTGVCTCTGDWWCINCEIACEYSNRLALVKMYIVAVNFPVVIRGVILQLI